MFMTGNLLKCVLNFCRIQFTGNSRIIKQKLTLMRGFLFTHSISSADCVAGDGS